MCVAIFIYYENRTQGSEGTVHLETPQRKQCLCCRDFAYVSVDESRDSYTCHVFRSDTVACRISDALQALTTGGHVITAASGGYVTAGSRRTADDVTVTKVSDCVGRRAAAADNHGHVTTTRSAHRPTSLPNLISDNCSCCHGNGQLNHDVMNTVHWLLYRTAVKIYSFDKSFF